MSSISISEIPISTDEVGIEPTITIDRPKTRVTVTESLHTTTSVPPSPAQLPTVTTQTHVRNPTVVKQLSETTDAYRYVYVNVTKDGNGVVCGSCGHRLLMPGRRKVATQTSPDVLIMEGVDASNDEFEFEFNELGPGLHRHRHKHRHNHIHLGQ